MKHPTLGRQPRRSIAAVFIALGVSVGALTSEAENNTTTTFSGGGAVNYGGHLIIGTNGVNNTLLIGNNTQVTSTLGTIGRDASASNNYGTVTGAGSSWTTTAGDGNGFGFFVGFSGSSNALTIAGGAVVNNSAFHNTIGWDGNANHMLVTGSGSVWTNAATVGLGYGGGSSNRLTVSNGGKVDVNININHGIGGIGNVIDVTGIGSRISVAGVEAMNGIDGRLILQNGGKFISNIANIASGAGARGNQVIVTGSGSTWTNGSVLGGNIIVGGSGVNNSLIVSDGAIVHDNTSQSGGFTLIGNSTSASNNYVRVTGSGARLVSLFGLKVGDSGSSNSLFVADGGTVRLEGAASLGLIIGANSGSANNLVQVDGGNLIVTNTATSTHIDVRRGKLEFNSGLIDTQRLLATNGASSVVQFNGGTLVTRDTTVNNGSAFVVGNGSSAANLQLRGGTHTFTDGLTIAQNGSLSGTGTVVGAVTQAGTIAPGLSPGQLDITGNLTQQLSSVLSLEIGGLVQGTQYDFLNVTGAATVDGLLDVDRFGGFLPVSANTFTVLTASAGLGGVFTNAPGSGRYSFDSGYWDVTYTANSVLLSNFVVPEPSTLLLLAAGGCLVWRRVRK